MTRARMIGWVALFLLVCAPMRTPIRAQSPASAPVRYTFEDLGLTDVRALNDSGGAAGSLGSMAAKSAAGVEVLGTLPSGTFSMATAINDAGLAAGISDNETGMTRAVLFHTDGATDLNAGDASSAADMNALGMVAGTWHVAGMPTAFRYADGVLTDLGGLEAGYGSQATGINRHGVVVGAASTPTGVQPFAAAPGTAAVRVSLPDGYAGGYATDVNDDGTVVGAAIGHNYMAFSAAAGRPAVSLGALTAVGSWAEAVNNLGAAVGFAYLEDYSRRAVLYSNGTITDLNTAVEGLPADWVLVNATDINDAGQIAALAFGPDGVRTLRLTPLVVEGDTTAPLISAVSASPHVLSPANHRMVRVEVSVTASDDSGEAPACAVVALASSEPADGDNDGDTAVDMEQLGPLTVNLRAERSGSGSGRTYTITVSCADAAGNSSQATATVRVPVSQEREGAALARVGAKRASARR